MLGAVAFGDGVTKGTVAFVLRQFLLPVVSMSMLACTALLSERRLRRGAIMSRSQAALVATQISMYALALTISEDPPSLKFIITLGCASAIGFVGQLLTRSVPLAWVGFSVFLLAHVISAVILNYYVAGFMFTLALHLGVRIRGGRVAFRVAVVLILCAGVIASALICGWRAIWIGTAELPQAVALCMLAYGVSATLVWFYAFRPQLRSQVVPVPADVAIDRPRRPRY